MLMSILKVRLGYLCFLGFVSLRAILLLACSNMLRYPRLGVVLRASLLKTWPSRRPGSAGVVAVALVASFACGPRQAPVQESEEDRRPTVEPHDACVRVERSMAPDEWLNPPGVEPLDEIYQLPMSGVATYPETREEVVATAVVDIDPALATILEVITTPSGRQDCPTMVRIPFAVELTVPDGRLQFEGEVETFGSPSELTVRRQAIGPIDMLPLPPDGKEYVLTLEVGLWEAEIVAEIALSDTNLGSGRPITTPILKFLF